MNANFWSRRNVAVSITVALLALIGVCLWSADLRAAEPADPPAAENVLPPELNDPAFHQFVNPVFLGLAWQRMDAATLTDAALLMAEGERVLLRPHKAVPAKFLMDVAAKLAMLQNDSASLERLAKAAESRKDDALAKQLQQSLKLAGVSRDGGPKVPVDAEAATPEQFDVCKAMIRDIHAATLVGDAKALDQMKAEIAKLDVPAGVRDSLTKMCGTATAAKDAKADTRVDAMNKLSAASRQWPGTVFPGGPGAWPGTWPGAGPIVVPGAPGNVSIWNPERVYNPWTNVPIPGTVQGVNRWDPMTGQWVTGTTWVDPYGRPRGNLEYTNPWTGQRTGVAYSRKGVDGSSSSPGSYVPGSGTYGPRP